MRNCKNGPLVFIRILFGCFQISSKILRILTGENSYAIGRSRTNRNFSQLFASIPISTNPIGHQLGYHPKTIKSLIPDVLGTVALLITTVSVYIYIERERNALVDCTTQPPLDSAQSKKNVCSLYLLEGAGVQHYRTQ